MLRLLAFAVVALLSIHQIQAFTSQHQQQQTQLSYDHASNNNDNEIHIGPALESDLDDITTVFLDAFSPGPTWQYIYPNYTDWHAYQWRCTRREIGRQFHSKLNNTLVNVIRVSTNSNSTNDSDDSRKSRVVSLAVWKIMAPRPTPEHEQHEQHEHQPQSPPTALFDFSSLHARCSAHLDANTTRAAHFNAQFTAAEERYISEYPRRHLYLGLLATHPDFDGRGFGPAHCRWGLGLARRLGVATTLIATPMGWPLYDSLGFVSRANITIETLDWPEDLWFEYMRYDSGIDGTDYVEE